MTRIPTMAECLMHRWTMAVMDEPTCWRTDSRRRDCGAANRNTSPVLTCKQQFKKKKLDCKTHKGRGEVTTPPVLLAGLHSSSVNCPLCLSLPPHVCHLIEEKLRVEDRTQICRLINTKYS